MKKQYTKKQIEESIKYWKKILEESYDEPYLYDSNVQGKIATVGQLKAILQNFKDTDIIDVCDFEGVPGNKIEAVWNSNEEFEMTGDDDGRDNVCYIRFGE